jgi:hypothetical protein
MLFERLIGVASAELAQIQSTDDLKQAYRQVLEMDGVVFPTPEVEQTIRLWEAQAAVNRGAPALADDGSIIDLDGFDREAAGIVLRANREPLDNAKRLDSLAQLGFLSKASSLFVARTIAHDGTEKAVTGARNITGSYKKFVQLSMATAGWTRPWQEVANHGFEGPSLTLPLDREGVLGGLRLLHNPFFSQVGSEYFADVTLLSHNLFLVLSKSDECEAAPDNQVKAVAQIGVFYTHSPQGCDETISQLAAKGRLAGDIDWLRAIRRASTEVPG